MCRGKKVSNNYIEQAVRTSLNKYPLKRARKSIGYHKTTIRTKAAKSRKTVPFVAISPGDTHQSFNAAR